MSDAISGIDSIDVVTRSDVGVQVDLGGANPSHAKSNQFVDLGKLRLG